MKKRGFLSAPVAELSALMGHMDCLSVCDATFTVPSAMMRIDPAICR
jgi:D-ribose pyranose/furanose isomerase RbsD